MCLIFLGSNFVKFTYQALTCKYLSVPFGHGILKQKDTNVETISTIGGLLLYAENKAEISSLDIKIYIHTYSEFRIHDMQYTDLAPPQTEIKIKYLTCLFLQIHRIRGTDYDTQC